MQLVDLVSVQFESAIVRIMDELLQVSNDEHGDLQMDKTMRFLGKSRNFGNMLGAINDITASLQTTAHSVSSCRHDFETLPEAIMQSRDKPKYPLYQRKLGNRYIYDASHLDTEPYFLLRGLETPERTVEELSDEEKEANKCLLKEHDASSSLSRAPTSTKICNNEFEICGTSGKSREHCKAHSQ